MTPLSVALFLVETMENVNIGLAVFTSSIANHISKEIGNKYKQVATNMFVNEKQKTRLRLFYYYNRTNSGYLYKYVVCGIPGLQLNDTMMRFIREVRGLHRATTIEFYERSDPRLYGRYSTPKSIWLYQSK